ncbi:Mitochondrial import receptor subunit Tom22 family protein [Babesia bovis T2Bo]|uniref:Mitochondrial import receptor subunit TOM22 n=1 Tax=Babesia bovis TaxID=5865 RepID=A7AMW2_BABBO|nr:Mitochondrial import receptor subunit Tom22 family protein [Babesia bovis T2Bo]EDO07896.1 Mitochondrial import receptor subunit Tom22 family protein [Babesia bovis T2Bo]|eukprot:XP_001611464.1 hypothetical protein [Babesia bovis T2Bo]
MIADVGQKPTFLIRVRRKANALRRSIVRFTKRTISFIGWVLWIAGTSAVTLVGPVMFHYDKECQLLEMQQQMLQAQQAASAPILN